MIARSSELLRIYLVACGAKKRAGVHPAAQLYVGPLFRQSMQLAESSGDPWFIISAAHGLVRPDQPLRDYDATLAEMDSMKQAAWAADVANDLVAAVNAIAGDGGLRPGGCVVTILGSRLYAKQLGDLLIALGFIVDRPIAGLSLCRSMGRLYEMRQEMQQLRAAESALLND